MNDYRLWQLSFSPAGTSVKGVLSAAHVRGSHKNGSPRACRQGAGPLLLPLAAHYTWLAGLTAMRWEVGRHLRDSRHTRKSAHRRMYMTAEHLTKTANGFVPLRQPPRHGIRLMCAPADMHAFDIKAGTWREVGLGGAKQRLPPRSVAGIVACGSRLLLFGGEVEPTDLGHEVIANVPAVPLVSPFL